MKLVKIKSAEDLGFNYEYASKYMYRLYRPDEDGFAIYMPVEIAEETREYLEALLWTGIQANEEIRITEGADYVYGKYEDSYIRKIQHFFNPVYIASTTVQEIEASLDMIMYTGGIVMYMDGIPEEMKLGQHYFTQEQAGSIKVYTGREDCFIISEVLNQHLKNKDVVFSMPSKIIVSMTELRELVEGEDYVIEKPGFEYTGPREKIVTIIKNPIYVLSSRLKAYLTLTEDGAYKNVDTYMSQDGLQFFASDLPSWACDVPDAEGNLDYITTPVASAMKVYTAVEQVYVISKVFADSLGDLEVLYDLPKNVEYNIEINPEDIILNYEGAYKLPVEYEDHDKTAAINNTEHLVKVNEAIDSLAEWTTEDMLSPLQAIAALINKWAPDGSYPELDWFACNRWDKTCDVLTAADAVKPTVTSSCGCGNTASTFDFGSTCSALDKYVNYQNTMAAAKFGDLSWYHKTFMIALEGNTVRNDELIAEFKDYLELLKNNVYGVITNTNPFCCPAVGVPASLVTAIDNYEKVLDIIGTPEECTRKTFVQFWGSKLIEELMKL